MINYQPEPDIPFSLVPDNEGKSINDDFFTRYLLN
jgi:hypothetical protein